MSNKRNDPVNPIFQNIFNAHFKLTSAIQRCYFCDHPIDTTNDSYERIDTLESVVQHKPRAYAHELCIAELEAAELDNAHEQSLGHMFPTLDQDYYDAFGEEL